MASSISSSISSSSVFIEYTNIRPCSFLATEAAVCSALDTASFARARNSVFLSLPNADDVESAAPRALAAKELERSMPSTLLGNCILVERCRVDQSARETSALGHHQQRSSRVSWLTRAERDIGWTWHLASRHILRRQFRELQAIAIGQKILT